MGNQIVQISIKFPTSLNDEQKELLEKLSESFGIKDGMHQEQKGLFEKSLIGLSLNFPKAF